MNELNRNIQNLSWRVDENLQKQAIRELTRMGVSEVNKLIMPLGKDCWGNAAEVIYNLSDDIIEPIIPELLVWVQDINWPGSSKIIERLSFVKFEVLKEKSRPVIRQAIEEKDLEWKENIEAYILKR